MRELIRARGWGHRLPGVIRPVADPVLIRDRRRPRQYCCLFACCPSTSGLASEYPGAFNVAESGSQSFRPEGVQGC